MLWLPYILMRLQKSQLKQPYDGKNPSWWCPVAPRHMSVSVRSFGLLSDVGSRCSFLKRDLGFCWLVGLLFQEFFDN